MAEGVVEEYVQPCEVLKMQDRQMQDEKMSDLYPEWKMQGSVWCMKDVNDEVITIHMKCLNCDCLQLS